MKLEDYHVLHVIIVACSEEKEEVEEISTSCSEEEEEVEEICMLNITMSRTPTRVPWFRV